MILTSTARARCQIYCYNDALLISSGTDGSPSAVYAELLADTIDLLRNLRQIIALMSELAMKETNGSNFVKNLMIWRTIV